MKGGLGGKDHIVISKHVSAEDCANGSNGAICIARIGTFAVTVPLSAEADKGFRRCKRARSRSVPF